MISRISFTLPSGYSGANPHVSLSRPFPRVFLNPHFSRLLHLQLISSKVPKAEYVPTIIRRDDPSIIPILYVSPSLHTHTQNNGCSVQGVLQFSENPVTVWMLSTFCIRGRLVTDECRAELRCTVWHISRVDFVLSSGIFDKTVASLYFLMFSI